MFCRYCGREIQDDASFCPYCGKSLVKAAPELAKPAADGESPKPEPTVAEPEPLDVTPTPQADEPATPESAPASREGEAASEDVEPETPETEPADLSEDAEDETQEDAPTLPEDEPASEDADGEILEEGPAPSGDEDVATDTADETPEGTPESPEGEPEPEASSPETPKPASPTSAAPSIQQPLPPAENPARRKPSLSRRALFTGLGAAAGIGVAAALYLRLRTLAAREGEQAEPEDLSTSSPHEVHALPGEEEALAATAAYGSFERALVNTVTIITPYGRDGEPVPSYEVRIRAAVDASGADIDLSGVETTLEVDDPEGFTLDELGDLPEGTYEVTVTTSEGEVLSLPPLEVAATPEDSGDSSSSSAEPVESGERLDVKPARLLSGVAAVESPVRLGKWGAFLKVVRDGIAQYGEPEARYDANNGSFFLGLGMVRLIDFGDGNTRLVIGYLRSFYIDPIGEDYPYVLEVWEYDGDSGEASLVLSLENNFYTPHGMCFEFGTNPQGDVPYICYFIDSEMLRDDESEEDAAYGFGFEFYGLLDGGGIGQVASAGVGMAYVNGEWQYDYGEWYYYVNGRIGSQDDYMDVLSEYQQNYTRYDCFAFNNQSDQDYGPSVSPQEIVDEAERTIASLEDLAGDVLDAFDSYEVAGG